MTERRRVRQLQSASGRALYVGNELPPDMAMGPCLEVWAGKDATFGSMPWLRARRNWNRAVDAWAVSSGWAREGRPASNARNLARTRHVWSKKFLVKNGDQALVDYFEGRRETRPTRDPVGFKPYF